MLDEQKKGLQELKKAHKDNAALHEGTLTRLNKLEEEIKEVRKQASRSRSDILETLFLLALAPAWQAARTPWQLEVIHPGILCRCKMK